MQSSKWDAWSGWDENYNSDASISAVQFIRELCFEYQKNFELLESRYRTKSDSDLQMRKKEMAELHQRYAEKHKQVDDMKRKEYDNLEAIGLARINSLTSDLDRYLSSLRTERKVDAILEKIFASFFSNHDKRAINAMIGVEQVRESFNEASAKHVRAIESHWIEAKKQVDFEKALNERMQSCADETGKAMTEEEQLKESEHMREHYSLIIENIMNKSRVSEYINTVKRSEPNALGYVCSTSIPKYVELGNISLRIAGKSEISPSVTQFLLAKLESIINKKTMGEITVNMPYVQSLEEGLSLFASYTPAERILLQEHLRMILLKLFMVFPAGKLEAAMIDPLELGETFSMFTKLGEEQARIIDTKIWSQEKDIGECIAILRQKLETMTQSYGADKETRLKKEPIRVLAITDFPIGFSEAALRDLRAIVRKSASYGVCVFIWANQTEMEKLKESHQSIFNEIKHMLSTAKAEGDALVLECPTYYGMSKQTSPNDESRVRVANVSRSKIILNLDTMENAKENSASIINTLVKGIHDSQRKIERFVDMFEDIENPENWGYENSISELAIPIGIKGAGTIIKLIVGRTDGSTAHHALIAGQTGAGKSTLLHTIIMSTLLCYRPDEAQLYLVDFKEGVEFKSYSKLNLPAIRVVAIDCEREFGLNVLKELQKEMKQRFEAFKREADREDIHEYRKVTGRKIPKLLVVFDEVQELFREAADNISRECEKLLGELLTLGRAAGIHIILASQNFNLMSSIKPILFSHAAIRIAIKGSEESARSVLGDNNPGAKQLQDGAAGAAVYNAGSGKESANTIFQVSYLEKDKRAELMKKLSALYNSEIFSNMYKEKTRVLLTSAEDDVFNVFNLLINRKEISTINSDENHYSMIIGEGFQFNSKFRFNIIPETRSNLLIVGSEEKRAAAMFYFLTLSCLYAELGNKSAKKNNELIYLIDLSVEEEYIDPNNTSFVHLENCFHQQIKHEKMKDMEAIISNAYDILQKRMNGSSTSNERLFIFFFGVNRAHKLQSGNMYENDSFQTESSKSKMDELLRCGPNYGINTIVWSENLPIFAKMFGNSVNRDFAHRIAFSTDGETLEQLVMEPKGNFLRDTTAIYMNVDEDVKNTHFRPYEIPSKAWVDEIAAAYREYE